MIDWNKNTEQISRSASDYIRDMENAVDNLCERLSKDSKDFDSKLFFDTLHAYIMDDNRLLYTNITNYIFSLEKEEVFGIMQTNLDKVINYMFSEQFDLDHVRNSEYQNENNSYDRTKRTVLKMWDHMNLAKRQYSLFKMTDADYTRIVEEKMKEAESALSKELNGQLISLVAIFTALSFLVFGGISSLDNIFSGAKDIPVTKLMIIGTIWCFSIMNLVFVFMFFIAKLTGLNIKSSQNVNANLVQKYPLIWWCNLVLVSILSFSCWVYYIKCEGFSENLYGFLSRYSTPFFIIGTIVIMIFIGAAAWKIYRLSKNELSD